MAITRAERELLSELNSDNVEYREGGSTSRGVGAEMRNITGNPDFVSQFDLNLTLRYSRVDIERDTAQENQRVSANVSLEPVALPANLKNDVAGFIFGNSDYNGGYRRCKQLFPLANWSYGSATLVESSITEIVLPNLDTDFFGSINVESQSVKNGQAVVGDIILPLYWATIPDVEGNYSIYVCEVIVNCKQVSYGTLLDAISSDRFTIDTIRYKIPDASKTSQYEKQLRLIRQSLFGKLSTDDVSPAAYQRPEQFQVNIVDIPLVKGIDKESAIGTYMEYDVDEILLSIYVKSQRKVTQTV